MASIRGHQGEFRILEDGNVVDIIEVLNVSVKMDGQMMRSKYVGRATPVGDQAIEGWSGSMDMEVVDDTVELFIDNLVNNNLAGIGVADYAFVVTENYDNGTSASYLYSDCQFMYSRENGGLDAKITKKLDFQASTRIRI